MALSFNLWRHFYCLIHRNCLDLKGPYLNTDRDDEKTSVQNSATFAALLLKSSKKVVFLSEISSK